MFELERPAQHLARQSGIKPHKTPYLCEQALAYHGNSKGLIVRGDSDVE